MRVVRGLVVFALLLSLAVGLAACGSGGDREATDVSASTPRGLAESANFEGVHSAEVEIGLEIDRYKPGKPEEVNMRILGSFLGAGEGSLPEFDMAIESKGPVSGRNVEFGGGLLLRSDYAVANFEKQTYQPDDATFEDLKSKFEEAQSAGDEGNALACVEAAQGIELSRLVHDFKDEGVNEYFDGTRVTFVSGELDIPNLVEALIRLQEDPACGAQLEAAGVPPRAQLEAARKTLEGRIKEASVQLMIGKRGMLRNLIAKALGRNANGEMVEVEFDIRVLSVNETTELATARGSAPFPQLLKAVGLSEDQLAEADGGEILTGFIEGIGKLLTGRGGY